MYNNRTAGEYIYLNLNFHGAAVRRAAAWSWWQQARSAGLAETVYWFKGCICKIYRYVILVLRPLTAMAVHSPFVAVIAGRRRLLDGMFTLLTSTNGYCYNPAVTVISILLKQSWYDICLLNVAVYTYSVSFPGANLTYGYYGSFRIHYCWIIWSSTGFTVMMKDRPHYIRLVICISEV